MRRYGSESKGIPMRKLLTGVLAAALAIAALGLGGCSLLSHASDDANALISSANTNLKNYQASDEKVRTLAAGLNDLGITPADATTALGITASIEAELAVQKKELTTASEKIAKIKTLDVDATFKKYADLEVAALAAQSAVVDEGVKVYAEMDKLYTGLRDGTADTKTTTQLSANIATISANIKTLSDAASKAIEAANAYFNTTTPAK